jgi:hypothetical protein
MKSALDIVFSAQAAVAALCTAIRTGKMTLVDSQGTDESLSDIYRAGGHGLEIAVVFGGPVEPSVCVSFDICSGGDTDASIIADSSIGTDKWSFQFKVMQGRELSPGAAQASAIAAAMGLEKDVIKVVDKTDEAMTLVAVPAAWMLDLEAAEHGAGALPGC